MTRAIRHAHRLRRGLVILCGLALTSVTAQSQALRLILRDSANGTPIIGALVSARDSTGATRADGLSNDRGMLLLRLPSAGQWQVHIRRIGLAPRLVPAMAVAEGAVVTVDLSLASVRQTLARVRVTARAGHCGSAPQGGDRTALLWESVSLALRSSTLSRDDSLQTAALRVREVVRELSPELEPVNEQITRQGYGVGRAFVAIHPDSLESRGYIQREPNGELSFYAPDEVVLISDSFLRTHCFETPKKDANPALAELRFKPVRGRSLPEVEGTAYVDTLSGELRLIEYRYIAPRNMVPVEAKYLGGDVVMRRMPNGVWYVSAWAIRMPMFAIRGIAQEYYLHGYREVGGTVEEMPPPDP
jgi:hypothetical protein